MTDHAPAASRAVVPVVIEPRALVPIVVERGSRSFLLGESSFANLIKL
jgi:hypothetical protein